MNFYTLGVDFGTDSVRTILVEASTGRTVATSVFSYPRWQAGLFCNVADHQFRQHPLDYVEGLEVTIKDCLRLSGVNPLEVMSIGIDTTGSTPCLVDVAGMPLALSSGFEEHPDAMFVLWKDHTAIAEAERINRHAAAVEATSGVNYLRYCGGIYSAEWYWAKLMHVLNGDPAIRAAARGFVEHCDWMPFLLTGELRRGVCAAGHKALWAREWGGLPPASFFSSLDAHLDSRYRFDEVYTSDQVAGRLLPEWATRLGLHDRVVVAVGALDAHMGAVGGEIEPFYLSRIMGTSTCDIMVTPKLDFAVRGICGQVEGSVVPGLTGLEAGQSAFGDAYAWWSRVVRVPLSELTREAMEIEVTDQSELSLDWFNGRRTPDANHGLTGGFMHLNLATTPASLFRAIVEATCFGARAIIERFEEEGLPVKGLIGLGGISGKSPFIMQLLADITGKSIRIHASEQSCALGATMFAATAAGLYPDIGSAMKAMGPGFSHTYTPAPSPKGVYERRYQAYLRFGKFAGG